VVDAVILFGYRKKVPAPVPPSAAVVVTAMRVHPDEDKPLIFGTIAGLFDTVALPPLGCERIVILELIFPAEFPRINSASAVPLAFSQIE
jgi:hypothetical protein